MSASDNADYTMRHGVNFTAWLSPSPFPAFLLEDARGTLSCAAEYVSESLSWLSGLSSAVDSQNAPTMAHTIVARSAAGLYTHISYSRP